MLQEEITADNLALRHRHIYFAHVFKGQSHAPVTMRRFALGRGTLLDLEYLVDDEGKRVATFSYSAGFAGAIAAVRIWADKQAGTPPPYTLPRHYLSRQEFIDELRGKLARVGRLPTALVIGANGRSGRGAAALFDALGIEDRGGAGRKPEAGGPFPAILDLRHPVQLRFPVQTGAAFPDAGDGHAAGRVRPAFRRRGREQRPELQPHLRPLHAHEVSATPPCASATWT